MRCSLSCSPLHHLGSLRLSLLLARGDDFVFEGMALGAHLRREGVSEGIMMPVKGGLRWRGRQETFEDKRRQRIVKTKTK